ncbi:MAG: polyphosphate kinase 2 [Pseudanabaena sp.]|nr:MAG: polyphosphate kinase 2 [Pseudanabaena sp.]
MANKINSNGKVSQDHLVMELPKAKKAGKKKSKSDDLVEKSSKDKKIGNAKPKSDASLTKLTKPIYENELNRLHIELVKLQEWVKHKKLKVVVLFEGRDAAGKGGTIKRITECLNPRVCKVMALGTPSDREKTQWYFQRYAAHLPAAGEIILFDRSWYNRAGVERVMNFCTHEEYVEFLRSCPEFECMLQRAGIILIKYWFSVSDEEQEKRFQERIKNPLKRWKISPMDLEARAKWVEYSKAKDDMFNATDIKQSPWYVVNSDDKRRAHLNCISHLLSQVPYEDLTPVKIELPPRQSEMDYVRPPMRLQNFVPNISPSSHPEDIHTVN